MSEQEILPENVQVIAPNQNGHIPQAEPTNVMPIQVHDKETLEQRLQSLHDIVQILENSNLSIDEAIKTYSDGMRLAVSCRQTLNEMSKRVEEVRQDTMKSMNQLNNKEFNV